MRTFVLVFVLASLTGWAAVSAATPTSAQPVAAAASNSVLFDNTKAETAGKCRLDRVDGDARPDGAEPIAEHRDELDRRDIRVGSGAADNSAAKGEILRSTSPTSGTTGVAFASSTFGSGPVTFWGDSSPMDDGSGQSGNTLFNGWDDPAGTNAALALNATEWLAGSTNL